MRSIIVSILQPVLHLVILMHKAFIMSKNKSLKVRYGTTDLYTYYLIFLSQEYNYHFSFTPEFIIDAGANVGYASFFFKQKYPNAAIIAIEPEHSNFLLVQDNLKGQKSIEILNKAIWYEETKISLQAPKEKRQKDSFYVDEKGSENLIETVTPQLLINQNFNKKILFKMDVESAEKEIFAHPNDEWISAISGFIIETHDRFKPNCEAVVLEKLKKYGFDYEFRKGNLIFAEKK